jgi:hypothetical protein
MGFLVIADKLDEIKLEPDLLVDKKNVRFLSVLSSSKLGVSEP